MRELRAAAAALVLLPLLCAVPAVPAMADAVVAPQAPVPQPVVLQGTTPVLRWRNVDDAHVVRVLVRRVDGTAAPVSAADGTTVFDGAPLPDGDLQLALDTVTVGTTYTYGFWSFDAAGNASAESSHSIVATAVPVLVAPAIASDVGPGPGFALRWANPVSPPGTQYDVKYAVRDPLTGLLPDWTIWQEGTPATGAVFPGRAGTTYRLEVLSQDPYGNDTRHAQATVVEPYDTAAAVVSKGWRTLGSSRRWGGTVAVSKVAGARITWHAAGTQVTVIADRCPGCGRAVLRIDGTVRLVMDTHAATLSVRQQVGTVAHLSSGRHTISVEVVGTSGHPAVQMDALAVLN